MESVKSRRAAGLLLLAAFLWGSSFVASKICLNAGMKPFETVFYRMVIGSAGIALIYRRELKHFSKPSLTAGLMLGCVTSLIYTTEMFGITMVETTKASFLTSTNIVMMPFLCLLFFKTKPGAKSFIAAFVTIGGVAVMSLTGSESFSLAPGDLLLLCAGFLYAMGSIVVVKFGKGASAIQITFLQFFVTMLYTGIMTLIFEQRAGSYPADAVWAVLFLAAGPTLVCFLIKNYALQYLSPLRCTLILSLEGVFCAILSVIILHDHITPKMLAGILLIFTGISIENFGSYAAALSGKKQPER